MARIGRLLGALAVALLLGATALQPALADSTPTPSPSATPDTSQLPSLEQQLKQQQATVNSLANQVQSEQATVNALNARVAADQKEEKLLDGRMDQVARIEYERPALSLTTILDAQNLDQLLTGVAQARLVAKQQKQLFTASQQLRAKDQQDQSAAKAQLDKISQQKQQATSIAANTQAEIATLQSEQAAASQSSSSSSSSSTQTSSTPSFSASTQITLSAGPSNPNRFAPGYCTWYVATIYSIPWLGNADQWPAAAAAAGQAEGQTPVVGAIMESADSGYGHVSVVIAVADANDWTVTEMNYVGFDAVDQRSVTRADSNLVTFIY